MLMAENEVSLCEKIVNWKLGMKTDVIETNTKKRKLYLINRFEKDDKWRGKEGDAKCGFVSVAVQQREVCTRYL